MDRFAYVGSRTTRERNARGPGLSVVAVDARGELAPVQVVDDLVNPSYLAMHPDGTRLYTVHGDRTEVSAFAVAPDSGRLRLLNRQSTGGLNPVHLVLDADASHLVVTNHIGSSLAVLPVREDGSLGPIAQLVPIDGPPGPHRVEQQQAKPHFAGFDPSGRFLLVPDKGCDRVWVFAYASGRLEPGPQPFVPCREGSGPRHLAFHPTGRWVHVVNELDSTVATFRFDAGHGALAPLQWLPSVPDDFTGDSRAAAIAVSADGRQVYASNRGHDSIATFDVAPDTGRLRFVEAVRTGGRTPRAFTLSPDGRLLHALNEDSDDIVVFAIDAATGRLTLTGARFGTGSPVCLVHGRVPDAARR